MANYLSNHQKKNRIFAKRERELLHAIKHDCPHEKLLEIAEKLRAAKIAVFKSRFAEYTYNVALDTMASCSKEVQQWISMAPDEIVSIYRSQANIGQPQGPPSADQPSANG